MKRRLLWFVVNMCRLVVSTTFIFSGLVKLIDPVGNQYKVTDYLLSMGFPAQTWSVQTMALSVGLSLLEFCLGIYLLFGIRRRWTTRLILLFTLVYTPMTLWLASTNAVADCGCFGDAIHLSNWQTFSKNVVLLIMAALVWWKGRLLTRFISESVQWVISLYSALYGFFIALWCIYGEPIIDLRPFHIGQHIPTAMAWPEDPMLQPEILDFDLDEEILSDTSYTFLLIAPYLEKADDGAMERINLLYDYASVQGYRFLGLTASSSQAIQRWQDLTGAEYDFTFMDELTLKTMARSNPALILLHDGTITGKWSYNFLPTVSEMQTSLDEFEWAHPHPDSYKAMLLKLLLWYLVPLFMLTLIDRTVISVRWWRRRQGVLTTENRHTQPDDDRKAFGTTSDDPL